MSTNQNRPIITYENIALLKSSTGAHNVLSNSGANLSFLPLVQGINFSVNIPRTNTAALGTKDFVDQSNKKAPDVQFSVNTLEDFGDLFSGTLVTSNLSSDRNFYAYVAPEKNKDAGTERAANDVRYYSFETKTSSNVSKFAVPYSGTTIFEENFDGSERTVIGGPYTEPTGVHLDISSGKVYYGDKPINLFAHGANDAVVPFHISGKQFGGHVLRYSGHYVNVLSLEDGASIDFHWERFRTGSINVEFSGILSTPSGTLSLNAGETGRFYINDDLTSSTSVDYAAFVINSNKNILCSTFQENAGNDYDTFRLSPIETDIYRRKNNYEHNITGGGESVETTHYVSHPSGVFATDIADNKGTDSAGHIGFSKLTKNQAFYYSVDFDPSTQNDSPYWAIVAPYPNTETTVFYYSGGAYRTLYDLSFTGTKENPDARTGSFYPIRGDFIYKIESTQPIGVWINDAAGAGNSDEEALFGWNDASLPENKDFGQFLSFGNCFLNNISISQSINGLIQSQYSYVGSNMQSQQVVSHDVGYQDLLYTGVSVPAIDLTGSQTQNLITDISGISNYYSAQTGQVISHHHTNVIISGDGSVGNFLIKSDSIQNFSLNLPIQRKPIYSIGKKYPITRKVLHPNECSFSFSNRVSNFEVSGDRSNLKDFLNSDESYNITISGKSISNAGFEFEIENAKLVSQSFNPSIGSDVVGDLEFSFGLNQFGYKGEGLQLENGFFMLQENEDNILLES